MSYTLPRRLACRARLHNSTCWGNQACPTWALSPDEPRTAPRRRRWWFNYNPQARPLVRLLLLILAEPRDAAHALPRRLACRARLHNSTCWGNQACPRHGRRKR